MGRTRITISDNVYTDVDVEVDMELSHVKEFIEECEESEAREISVALNKKGLKEIASFSSITLDDEFKLRLMKKAINKYSLDELERRLGIDWL